MTFSTEWETHYASMGYKSGWYPYFLSLIRAYVNEADKFLELGFGKGMNIPYLLDYGYHGVDGSAFVVAEAKERHPAIADRIACCDFTKEIPFGGGFDAIVDRASVIHNDLDSIERCVNLIYDSLKPGGIFVGCDWFSTEHTEFERGESDGHGTRWGYTDGQFGKGHNIGKVHFTYYRELAWLFGKFEALHCEHRIAIRPGPETIWRKPAEYKHISNAFSRREYRSAVFDIVVKRPLS